MYSQRLSSYTVWISEYDIYTFSSNKARQIISMGGVDKDLIFRLNVINRINILDQLVHVSLDNFNDGMKTVLAMGVLCVSWVLSSVNCDAVMLWCCDAVIDINGFKISSEHNDQAGTINVYKFVALLLLNDWDIVIVILMLVLL